MLLSTNLDMQQHNIKHINLALITFLPYLTLDARHCSYTESLASQNQNSSHGLCILFIQPNWPCNTISTIFPSTHVFYDARHCLYTAEGKLRIKKKNCFMRHIVVVSDSATHNLKFNLISSSIRYSALSSERGLSRIYEPLLSMRPID